MSLIKRHSLTARQLAANRKNQKLCNGVLTDEGRERIRAAHLRHGFYSQAEEVALRALGEDPAEFQDLLEALWEEWQPTPGLQEELVMRLGRALWLIYRADRMQEGYALRQAQDASAGREDRRHVQMMRLKMTANTLRTLARSVAQDDYFTPREDLEMMKNLQRQGDVKEMAGIALDLFIQLQEPGTDEDGLTEEEKSREVVTKVRAIFGISTDEEFFAKRMREAALRAQGQQPAAGAALPAGQPVGGAPATEEEPESLSPEEEARERARQLLQNILTGQAEICEAQRKAIREELRKGPSPYERAAEIAPTLADAKLMRRMQDSNFREVRRATSLLLKLKNYTPGMGGLARNGRRRRGSPLSGRRERD